MNSIFVSKNIFLLNSAMEKGGVLYINNSAFTQISII